MIQQLKASLGKSSFHDLVAKVIADHQGDAPALLKRAAKGSLKRRQALNDALLVLGDKGCAISDAMIITTMFDRNDETRDFLLQSMKEPSNRIRFAPQLRQIAADISDPGWPLAVDALGVLNDRGAAEILLHHTHGHDTPFVVLKALQRLQVPEAAVVFEANLTHHDPRTRSFALWGLASLGYPAAIGGLVALLDDPDISTDTRFTPGQSMRAAQALADVHSWPFEWGEKSSFGDIYKRSKSLYSANFVAKALDDLANGRLEKDQARKHNA